MLVRVIRQCDSFLFGMQKSIHLFHLSTVNRSSEKGEMFFSQF